MPACRERFTVYGARLKWTYVTRVMPAAAAAAAAIGPHDGPARVGELIVTRVDRLGVHGHMEDPHGRRVHLYAGDLVADAYGNRYATDFYEGYLPEGARTHLLTPGGLIGTVAAAHDAHADPTTLEVVGRWPTGSSARCRWRTAPGRFHPPNPPGRRSPWPCSARP